MAVSYPSSPLDPTVRRPVAVTMVSILVWLAAGADVVAGVVFASNAKYRAMGRDVGMTQHELLWYGIAMIVVAVAAALVADGIGVGARWARPSLILLVALQTAGAALALTQLSWESQRSQAFSAVSQIVIAALILWAFTRLSGVRRRPAARGTCVRSG